MECIRECSSTCFGRIEKLDEKRLFRKVLMAKSSGKTREFGVVRHRLIQMDGV